MHALRIILAMLMAGRVPMATRAGEVGPVQTPVVWICTAWMPGVSPCALTTTCKPSPAWVTTAVPRALPSPAASLALAVGAAGALWLVAAQAVTAASKGRARNRAAVFMANSRSRKQLRERGRRVFVADPIRFVMPFCISFAIKAGE